MKCFACPPRFVCVAVYSVHALRSYKRGSKIYIRKMGFLVDKKGKWIGVLVFSVVFVFARTARWLSFLFGLGCCDDVVDSQDHRG
jgi:hypothetical protein